MGLSPSATLSRAWPRPLFVCSGRAKSVLAKRTREVLRCQQNGSDLALKRTPQTPKTNPPAPQTNLAAEAGHTAPLRAKRRTRKSLSCHLHSPAAVARFERSCVG